MAIKNTKQVLTDAFQKPIQEPDSSELTLGTAISKVLLFQKNDDPLKAYMLGNKFLTEEELNLTAEEIVFISKAIKASGYNPIVSGQILQIIEA